MRSYPSDITREEFEIIRAVLEPVQDLVKRGIIVVIGWRERNAQLSKRYNAGRI
jgi:hypothetical protein